MLPIESKGTKDRKWICTKCASQEEINSLDKDIIELLTTINPNFKEGK